jgi:hypothetical protein
MEAVVAGLHSPIAAERVQAQLAAEDLFPAFVRLVGSVPDLLVAADKRRNGEISYEEWRIAREVVELRYAAIARALPPAPSEKVPDA